MSEPAVVLVHGLPETAEIWGPLQARLDRRTVAVSLPGFGTRRPDGFSGVRLAGAVPAALAPPDAFQLFTRTGERAWAEGWEPHFPVAVKEEIEPGTVFEIDFGGHASSWLLPSACLASRLPTLVSCSATTPALSRSPASARSAGRRRRP